MLSIRQADESGVMLDVSRTEMKILIASLLILFSSLSFSADLKWTGDSWESNGITAKGIKLDLDLSWIVVRGSDNGLYKYSWGTAGGDMTENAKSIYSTLLAAYAANLSFSLYYEDTESYKAFTKINLHK